jgi:hypothetical protein
MELSIQQARELAELTDRIVTNLKAIDDDGSTEDSLKEMYETTDRIAGNLQAIAESQDR